MTDDGKMTTLTVVGGEGGAAAVQVDQVDHEALRQRARDARARIEEDGWALSDALADIYDGALYQAWGYASWKDYIDQEMEFEIRKALYFVNVQHWIRRFAPEFAAWARTLGVSKARLLTARVTPENAAEWRPRLEGKTYREIEDILAGEQPEEDDDDGDGGDGEGEGGSKGKESTEQVRFNLYPAQRANVDLAVARAKEQAQTDSDAHALDLIATSFLSGDGHLADMAAYLGTLERAFGVRLVALQARAPTTGKIGKILYGDDLLDELLAEFPEEEQAEERARMAQDPVEDDDADMDDEGDDA